MECDGLRKRFHDVRGAKWEKMLGPQSSMPSCRWCRFSFEALILLIDFRYEQGRQKIAIESYFSPNRIERKSLGKMFQTYRGWKMWKRRRLSEKNYCNKTLHYPGLCRHEGATTVIWWSNRKLLVWTGNWMENSNIRNSPTTVLSISSWKVRVNTSGIHAMSSLCSCRHLSIFKMCIGITHDDPFKYL